MYTGARLAGYQDGLEERRLRLLAWAVLVSLVLHASILLFLSQIREIVRASPTPPPLTARLVEPPKPKPPEPPPPQVERVVPVPVPPKAPVAKPRPQAAPVRAPVPTLAPSAPPPILSVEPKPSAEPTFVVPAAPAEPGTRMDGQLGTASPAAPAIGPDPGSLARFRVEFMEIASRYKRYPRIAQDNNWQGRVELRIAFSESGAISSLSVRKGTGRPVLDEEAQAMIRRAAPQAVIPPALRGKAFTLDIPVDFFLKEER